MRNCHISIPELDERNLSSEDFFRVVYVMAVHELNYLIEIHPSKAINNIDDFPLQLAKRIMDSAHTLYHVIEKEQDYVVSFSIIRSIADMLSSFILIYNEQNTEIRALRHYLYIIDGLHGRLSLLPNEIRNDGLLKKEEYESLQKQILNAKDNYSNAVESCIEHIKNLTIYSKYKKSVDLLIKKRNWKYTSFSNPKKYYSWNEMYDLIKLNLDGKFISSLSDFVHGLSTSLLIVEINTSTFEPVYGIAISLIGKLMEIIEKLYSKDMEMVRKNMLSVLEDEAMPSHYVQYIIEQAMKKKKN